MKRLIKYKINESFKVKIQGINSTIKLSINRDYRAPEKWRGRNIKADCNYWIEAVVIRTGFDLCDMDNGYFKHRVTGNPKLRSKKSIEAELNDIYESFKNSIINSAESFIIDQTAVQAEINGEWFHVKGANRVDQINHTMNINSNISNTGVAWYHHDVYNQGPIELSVTRCSKGYLVYTAAEKDLYDFKKLKKLSESKDFKEQKYAFFKYNEVKRLLGLEFDGSSKSMSGLFSSRKSA